MQNIGCNRQNVKMTTITFEVNQGVLESSKEFRFKLNIFLIYEYFCVCGVIDHMFKARKKIQYKIYFLMF